MFVSSPARKNNFLMEPKLNSFTDRIDLSGVCEMALLLGSTHVQLEHLSNILKVDLNFIIFLKFKVITIRNFDIKKKFKEFLEIGTKKISSTEHYIYSDSSP